MICHSTRTKSKISLKEIDDDLMLAHDQQWQQRQSQTVVGCKFLDLQYG